jgi:hypothetical protein
MKHLTDDNLQKYLDKDPAVDNFEVKTHLQNCKQCQQNMILYKKLYSGLADDTGFMLSANFSQSVISKLDNKGRFKSSFLEGLLVGIALVISLGLTIYFTNFDKVFLSAYEPYAQKISDTFSGVFNLPEGEVTLFVFAIIILFLIGFADKLIFQVRHR